MLKIGDFSKLSRISIQMLRHYDKIGLLHPSFIDETSGYRFYDEEQLPAANRIRVLKEMGFSLPRITVILSEDAEGEDLKKHWEEQLQRQYANLDEVQKRIILLEDAIETMDNDNAKQQRSYSIDVKEISALTVMSYRRRISSYDKEGELWERLYREMHRQKARECTPAYHMAVFHDEGFVDQNPDVEVRCAVEGRYESNEDVRFMTIDAVRVASTTYQGGYEELSVINAEMARWIKKNGYRLSGPGFNIYHVSPQTESDPEKMVTEVCFPIEKIAIRT